ncbi:MAG: FtsX-like permease family protein [Cellvibrio sp.]|uniref:ABC transporter permease n=1 Tax=Cellvibrio sp. TaxID=1965322 RepID=UPI0027188FEC|nr:FtsX-like permease family protein [Cellvibrio sp.]
MRALHIKLLRNLWGMKGQGLAIAAVIATGVAMFVMSLTALESLYLSQQSVYRSQQFAEVFASVKRAPEALVERLRDLPGVALVETRVQAPLRIQIPAFAEPISGLAVSIPDGRQPQLNQLFFRAGGLPDPERDDQLVVSEAFAEAHELQPGDSLAVIINGRYQHLQIAGIALSPEFIYQIRPGDLFPDFSRYAIVWINRSTLEAAFGMDGAFNNLVLSLAPGSRPEPVIAELDLLLAPWGGLGAYDRNEQISHRYLTQELEQLKAMALVMPLIFISVAAFLLNVVAARVIRTQREQIAVLKAFGYTRTDVALHYLQLVLVVVLIGSVAGVLLGVWMASGMAGMYQEFFRFPWLEFRLRWSVAVLAIVIAGGATLVGVMASVLRAFRLPPAEAMRPEPPARYRPTVVERLRLDRFGIGPFSQPVRMILRNLERQPVKAGLSIIGIAFAVAIMMVTGFQRGAITYMLDVQFRLAQKQDVTVSFYEPAAARALYELVALPGVSYAEPFRAAPAILYFGQREYRTALQGYVPQAHLFSVLDARLQPIAIPEEGLLLTDHLAHWLGVRPGDTLQVSVQEGRRPLLEIPVVGLVQEYIGVGAYVHHATLSRLLRESDTISGAFLAVDAQALPELQRRLEQIPRVAAVTLRENSIRAFFDMMDQSILVFTLFSTAMAGAIAFAVVYNNARIAFAERAHELATLRVLGFARAEVAFILVGELLLLTLLAVPVGFVLGVGLCELLTLGMQTDLYRVPLILTAETYATSALVVLVASVASLLIVGRSLAQLDMVSALKARD